MCRVGDIGVGVCLGHKVPTPFVTVFLTGDGTVSADGRDVTRVGDIGIASCGHITIAVTGSPTSTCSGRAIHRVGDIGISTGGGVYVATVGSGDVVAG